MTETWLPVVGFEGLYSVSDQGHVRFEARTITKDNHGTMTDHHWPQHLVDAGLDHGYPRVVLSRDGRRFYRRVHVLMLEAFVGPRPPGEYGLHDDDVKTNNTFPNLRWGTPTQNSLDKVRNGNCPKANQTHCINGHKYTEENTMRRPDKPNTRECRTCHRDHCREAAARYRRKKKEANV